MQILSIKTPIFTGGEDIFETLLKTGIQIKEGDILSISSKIVALSQNQLRKISDYGNTKEEAIEKLIEEEADKIFPGKYTLTIKNKILIPFAGIDASNIPDKYVLLWPKNLFKFAKNLHKKICEHFKIKNLGIIVTDSTCQPLRLGVTGIALVWYGFEGTEDERGEKDLFGKKLEITQKAVADNLASASILVQGEGSECTPFALIKGAPVSFQSKENFLERSHIDPDEDIFKNVMCFHSL